MDFKTLLPDFNAIKKTDWAKPQVDTKDTMGLVALGAAALMVIFVFLPWTKLEDFSHMGLTTWYGALAFVMALCAVVGVLYNHPTLTFSASALGVIFGFLGIVLVASLTQNGVTVSGDKVKEYAENHDKSISHLGAILYLVASVASAALAYLKIAKK